MPEPKVFEILHAYEPGASKEALELRKSIDQETQDYLNKNFLNARYDYWKKIPDWTIKESVAILAGIEPEAVEAHNHPGNVNLGIYIRTKDLERILDRAKVSELGYNNTPIRIVQWAQWKRIPLPPELLELIEPEPVKPTTMPQPPKALDVRERETLLKLAAGMAAAWYGYDPDVKKSTVAKDIQNDLAAKGIELSDDTIRRHLKEGAQFLRLTTEEA